MDAPPFEVEAILDRHAIAKTLVDNGCLTYGVVIEDFVRKNNLPTIEIPHRGVKGVFGGKDTISQIVCVTLDVDAHMEDNAHFYVVRDCIGYDDPRRKMAGQARRGD
ncbi:hypothetical protein N7535_005463 [Penicillium sp. DV-2018c]|nr:hypothetical protein N7535_005463 [Penicillium sp. DV-2018c]